MVWVFVFVLAMAIPLTAWYWFFLTPLQKQYLLPFAWNQSAATSPHGQPVPTGSVWLVYKTAPKRKPELAHDADVVSATSPTIPAMPMKLSPEAQAAGWTGLTLTKQIVSAVEYEAFLREQFFAGKSLVQWMLSPVLFGATLFLLLLGSRARFGWQSDHEERHGRRTKGPELGSGLRSGRMGRANGIRFQLEGKLGLPGPSLRIPRKLESSHILLMGDTGSGKSNAIRQILRQVEARGETAVVYDPAGDFAQEFLRPERGDFLLNPLDERCPEWSLLSELTGQGMEYAIASAMLPEKEYGKDFFTEAPRRVLARLLQKKPTVWKLLAWMADPEEIERQVEGTPEAAYLDRKAGPQRGGVLASLNMIADSLALLPTSGTQFGTEEWRHKRTRWVFLTSRPSVRERLLPLHSVWLDLLILRMMEPCSKPAKPVWFVLDELASLNKLPQLHTAVTENRKYGNPVVLGFQGRSQLEKRYGQDAEAMLSQPPPRYSSRPRNLARRSGSRRRWARSRSNGSGSRAASESRSSAPCSQGRSKAPTRWRSRTSRW